MTNTSYDDFCINIQNEIKKLCEEGSVVHLQTVQKINGVILKGITIHTNNGNIMPTLYLEKFYREYQSGIPFDEVVTKFMKEYEKAGVKEDFDIQFFSDYEKVKPLLAYKLLHYEMNRELLTQIPHKAYLDLAIVCYCDIHDARIGHGSILIKNEHLDMWKITEEELLHDALENMPRLCPADFMNMSAVLKELYDDPVGLLSISIPMYVLTNKTRINGAASLLYDGQLEQIATVLKGDYYVLPSSIHEVIIMPKKENADENHLSKMVREINQEQLVREEILSNHAYLYLYEQQELIALP